MKRRMSREEYYRRKRLQRRRIFWFIIVPLIIVIALGIFGVHSLMGKFGGNDAPPVSAGGTEQESQTDAEAEETQKASDQRLDRIIEEMNLHDKVCQLFIVTPEELTGSEGAVTAAGDVTRARLKEYPVGGMIYFAQNMVNKEQTESMITHIQSFAKDDEGIPLFISVDEEGGKVARAADSLGTTKFNPMYTYRSKGASTARDNAKTIASDLSSLGFNLDFAPVADTWSNPENTVIGQRAYSDDYSEAAELVAAAVKGFHSGGVACTLKHFPGHGDTAEDTHEGAAYVDKSLEQLKTEDFIPFMAGIKAGADMVMVGHITVPSIDTVPATLSSVIIQDVLRKDLGFKGVVITDALNMGALANTYSQADAALKAFQAGNDILLCTGDLEGAVQALENAVNTDVITEEQVDQSVKRILKLKIDRGIL